MAELCQFLDPAAGHAENLDGRPCPERVLFLAVEEPVPAAGRVLRPDVAGRGVRPDRADERLPGRGELLARPGLPARLEQGQRVLAPLAGRPGQDGQDGQAVPGAGVHPGFAPPDGLAAVQVIGADRGSAPPTVPSVPGPAAPIRPGPGRSTGRWT